MKILIAVDFGLYGKAQIEFLRNIQGAKDVQMKLIHVVDPLRWELQSAYLNTMELANAIVNERRESAEKLLNEIASKLQKDYGEDSIEAEVREGNVAEEVLQAAEEYGANLIVVGSHGKTGMQRFMIGSVSQTVSTHAKCSVLIARPAASK